MKRFPLWSHLALHAMVLLFLAVVFRVAVDYGERATFVSSGLLPILAVAYLAFAVASLYEIVLDRLPAPRADRPDAAGRPSSSSASRETTRRSRG